MRKIFKKACAVVLCIGILSLAAPGTFAVQKKSPKVNVFKFFHKQITSVASMFTTLPVLGFLYVNQTQESIVNGKQKIKATGQLDIGRVSGGD